MVKNQGTYFLLAVVVLGVLGLIWFAEGGTFSWITQRGSLPAIQYYAEVAVPAQVQSLWALNNVSHGASRSDDRVMVANTHSLFFLGSLDNQPETLLEIDWLTGQVETNYQVSARIDTIGSNDQFIYAGVNSSTRIVDDSATAGVAQVIAYEIGSGNQAWFRPIRGASRISSIHTFGNRVSVVSVVATGDDHYQLLDADTGRDVYTDNQDYPVLYENGTFYYLNTNNSPPERLWAINIQTGNLLWEQMFSSRTFDYGTVHFRPLLEKEVIVGLTGYGSGHLFGIDSRTGTLLWQTDDSSYGNVAASNGVAYFLTVKAELKAVDVQTGKTLATVTFKPTTPQEKLEFGRVYSVAASDDIVVVYLGDSWQLFAFRFSR